jgi:hypothetical protein
MNKAKNRIENIASIFLYIISFFSILFLLIIPRNEYEWMKDIDPHLTKIPEDVSGNSILANNLFFLIVILAQGILCFLNEKRRRAIPLIIIFISIFVYIIKIL